MRVVNKAEIANSAKVVEVKSLENHKLNQPMVYDYSKIVELFEARAKSQKRISKIHPEIISKIFKYINLFNSLKLDVKILMDRPLSDWPVLKEFEPFIIPNSIRYVSGDILYSDILVRDKIYSIETEVEIDDKGSDDDKTSKDNIVYDYHDYLNLLSEFRGWFKKDASSDITSLESIKRDCSYSDVWDRFCFVKNGEWLCRYMDNPYIPYPVTTLNYLVEDRYFNSSDSVVVDDYFAKLFF